MPSSSPLLLLALQFLLLLLCAIARILLILFYQTITNHCSFTTIDAQKILEGEKCSIQFRDGVKRRRKEGNFVCVASRMMVNAKPMFLLANEIKEREEEEENEKNNTMHIPELLTLKVGQLQKTK
jgi:hypothetical protein